MKDRFDFEQDIFNCWHIVDDIKQLYEMATDRKTSTDDIANVLLGLHTLYDDRFQRLMDTFEHLIDVGDLSTQLEEGATEYTPKYEKLYTELLTKLRIISETDEIASDPEKFNESGAGGKPVGSLADDPAGTGFKPDQTFKTAI